MRKTGSRHIFLGILFLCFCFVAAAQNVPNSALPSRIQNMQRNMPNYGNVPGVVDNDETEGEQAADTTKKPPRVRKPLESYFFTDSMRVKPSLAWSVNLMRNDITEQHVDTSLNGFQLDYPALQNDVGSAYLGNLGAATIPLNYFLRPEYKNFSFAQAFDAYLLNPQRVLFYNVKRPFTNLTFFTQGQTRKLEENLLVKHAQNISPATGFNIDYKSRGTKGYYAWQKARDKNLSLAFSHTGKKYTVHAGYIYNSVELKENGGLVRDQDITDTIFELPENIDVNLLDARNKMRNNTFYIVQSYGVPMRKVTDEDFSIAKHSTLFIGHSLEYSNFYKKYTDTKDKSGDFYKDWFINPTQTNDSIRERVLSNRVFVQIQPWDRNSVIGTIDAGIGNDMMRYSQFRLEDYLSKNEGIVKNSTYLYGAIQGHIKEYVGWNARAQYHPFGYRSQDLSLGGELTLSAFFKGRPITLRGSFSYDLRTPDYWTGNYFSNHFVWQNSFGKENETRISVTLDIPHIGVALGAHQSVIGNKVYYNAQSLPTQHSGTVSVTGLYAKKDFRLGGLHLNHRVLLQLSSAQEIAPVPMASAFLSYYYEFNVVKEVLRVQLGFDGRYNTEYYAFGYNPAIAQFYNQREKKLGNYPLIDVFVAAKWKRMRILAKLQHANEDLFGSRDYFTVLHYPLTKRVFKLGISWSFYD